MRKTFGVSRIIGDPMRKTSMSLASPRTRYGIVNAHESFADQDLQ
jgi:hypothetical protein